MLIVGCSLAFVSVILMAADGTPGVQNAITYELPASKKKTLCITNPPKLYGIGGAGYLFNVRKGRTLPPELVDEIIDYLHHNIRALKACSLTHRTWLPRSRYHLFRALRFRKFGVDAFRLSSAPEIAQYVREVTVEGNMYSEVGKSILVDMGKVESLHLEASKIHFTDVHRGLCQSHLPVFPMLKELTLRKVYFRSFAEMISTIRSYRRLNSLTLDFEDWKYLAANAPDSSMVLALPSLKRLEMRHNLIGSWPGPIPQILLNSAGADLHDLTFDIVTSPSRPPLSLMSHVDLSHNTRLRSLTLRFYWCIRAPWISSKEERAMISTVLSRIHSPDFRDITLHITFPASGYNDPRWLSRLDMRVLDHLFPSGSTAKSSSLSREDAKRVESVAKKLKTVTLALTFSRTMDVREFGIIQKVITAQLPTLSSKRVLRIIHVFRE